MYYYKVFNEESLLGVVSSHDLRVYSLVNKIFLSANENNAEYVQCKNKIYRVDWLKPETYKLNLEKVQMHIITKEEYDLEKRNENFQDQSPI